MLSGCFIFTNVQGNGTVTSVPPGNIACTNNTGDCQQEYTRPGTERLKAEPDPGYAFARWTNCPYKSIDECQTLPWTQDLANGATLYTITATFEEKHPPVQTAEYTYNALGQRTTRKVGDQVTIFQYDLDGNLMAEIDAATGLPLRQHIHVNGEPVAQLTTNPANGEITVQYVHADHLGTPTLLTNQSGQVVSDIEATPFGETYIDYAELTYNRRFPGQYKDVETGLHYNYFREYDPSLGRYIQSDPIGLEGGINTYAYVDGNPLQNSDPKGLIKVYGKWCGPNWTGGFDSKYIPGLEGLYSIPIDDLDASCQTHDICYYQCRRDNPCDKADRSACFRRCDTVLTASARGRGGFYARIIGAAINRPGKRNPGENEPDCECEEP
jgi:RHS repeat-associated protein